jgi:hypothetical protein
LKDVCCPNAAVEGNIGAKHSKNVRKYLLIDEPPKVRIGKRVVIIANRCHSGKWPSTPRAA